MALVIDIETVGERFDDIDATTQAELTRWLSRTTTAVTYDAHLKELKDGLGFSPLTGMIVALGVYDTVHRTGTIYYQTDSTEADETVEAFTYRPRTEAAMLAAFWEGVTYFDTIVTFNGRSFDVPFLLHRSVAVGVRPTIDLLRYRYLTQQVPPYHVDLQDQLTFYGAMGKRPSLHLFCRAYGIPSPKTEGVTGDDVATLYRAKQFRTIAEYNGRDLIATAALYEIWQTYLAPPLFQPVERRIDIL
jgi:uncharacterized protein YprB with RNaseH-like and TPR domain